MKNSPTLLHKTTFAAFIYLVLSLNACSPKLKLQKVNNDLEVTLSKYNYGKTRVCHFNSIEDGATTTAIYISESSYLEFGMITPEEMANNCAVKIYSNHKEDVGTLSIFILTSEGNAAFNFDQAKMAEMLEDYSKIEAYVRDEIYYMVTRDMEAVYENHQKHFPEVSKEAFDKKMESMLEFMPISYSKSKIVGLRAEIKNGKYMYVVKSSIYDKENGNMIIYESMIRRSELEKIEINESMDVAINF